MAAPGGRAARQAIETKQRWRIVMNNRFYRRRTVCNMLTLSESTLRRREKDDPRIPRAYRISKGRVVYDADEVDAYMHSLLNP
jgi:predicted DNA-binding transcriptional regulator AlpA